MQAPVRHALTVLAIAGFTALTGCATPDLKP
jgi:hypothetical protein